MSLASHYHKFLPRYILQVSVLFRAYQNHTFLDLTPRVSELAQHELGFHQSSQVMTVPGNTACCARSNTDTSFHCEETIHVFQSTTDQQVHTPVKKPHHHLITIECSCCLSHLATLDSEDNENNNSTRNCMCSQWGTKLSFVAPDKTPDIGDSHLLVSVYYCLIKNLL